MPFSGGLICLLQKRERLLAQGFLLPADHAALIAAAATSNVPAVARRRPDRAGFARRRRCTLQPEAASLARAGGDQSDSSSMAPICASRSIT